MDPKHRKAIQNNFTSLVERTDLDPVVHMLYERGVFSRPMIEPYKNASVEPRIRKRMLYRDIERRGPHAFGHLIETLTHTGHWELVRMLEPDGSMQFNEQRDRYDDSNFHSLRDKGPKGRDTPKPPPAPVIPKLPSPTPPTGATKPTYMDIKVVKSKAFMNSHNPKMSCYKTRTRNRGVLLIINIQNFENDVEPPRTGSTADIKNLKNLFTQIGFYKCLSYNDLSKDEFDSTIKQFCRLEALRSAECVFVAVASHGYERAGHADTDVRCADNRLLSKRALIEQFNDTNCPLLKGTPKVFIFQTCRGDDVNMSSVVPPARLGRAEPDGDGSTHTRAFNDILIAQSTLPGYASMRDTARGSWYIQAVCGVFAEHAHDCHVEELLTLVDRRLADAFAVQTSSVDKWGFNRLLYLHPGLFQDAADTS